MPCYLFTYHGYGTDGCTVGKHRGQTKYRETRFNARMQNIMIDQVLRSAAQQQFRPHFVASEGTHVHVLVTWTTDRAWQSLWASIRASLARRLNREFPRREWFSNRPRRRRVNDRRRFEYLVDNYLPQHSGWKWQNGRGYFNRTQLADVG